MTMSICLFSPTYENPKGFSIRFVFANLVAETRNEIIHKTVVANLKNDRIPNKIYFKEMVDAIFIIHFVIFECFSSNLIYE